MVLEKSRAHQMMEHALKGFVVGLGIAAMFFLMVKFNEACSANRQWCDDLLYQMQMQSAD